MRTSANAQIVEGGGEILDSEKGHFTRKEIKDNWRLGCQAKVKGDLAIKVPESVMGVKEWECTVIGNRNVATFIKEFKVQLPPGEHMDFEPRFVRPNSDPPLSRWTMTRTSTRA